MHTSCLVVSSHHYPVHNEYSISYRHQHFPPLRSRNPPPRPTNTQVYSNRLLRETPLVLASAATQEVAETVSYQKVVKRRRVPRATAKILHTDRTLDFLVNPPSSCAELHIYPRVAVPSGTAPSFTIHFSAPPHITAPSQLNLHVFQVASETNESIFNCQCNRYPCCSREERYASQVINIKAKSARPILLHHA